jgi:hypothetical protein
LLTLLTANHVYGVVIHFVSQSGGGAFANIIHAPQETKQIMAELSSSSTHQARAP